MLCLPKTNHITAFRNLPSNLRKHIAACKLIISGERLKWKEIFRAKVSVWSSDENFVNEIINNIFSLTKTRQLNKKQFWMTKNMTKIYWHFRKTNKKLDKNVREISLSLSIYLFTDSTHGFHHMRQNHALVNYNYDKVVIIYLHLLSLIITYQVIVMR